MSQLTQGLNYRSACDLYATSRSGSGSSSTTNVVVVVLLLLLLLVIKTKAFFH